MLFFALGIFITYCFAPFAVFALLSRFAGSDQESPLRAAIISLSLGPISIGLLLFALFSLLPGRTDTFYVLFISAVMTLASITSGGHSRILRACQSVRLRLSDQANVFLFTVVQIGLILAALKMVLSSLRQAGPLGVNALEYTAIGGLLILGLLMITATVARWATLPCQAASSPFVSAREHMGAGIRWLRSQIEKMVLPEFLIGVVCAWFAVLIALLVGVTVYAGLGGPLTDNDPLEYAMVARAIYHAKSLDIYPLLTGLSGSGLYASSSHPPALHFLEVWGYFFDGSEATRLLRLSPLFYWFMTVLALHVYLRPYGRLAAVCGPLLVLAIPFLDYLGAVAHIDPMRIHFFFLSLLLTATMLTDQRPAWLVVCGIVWGMSLFSHSLGMLTLVICSAAYLVLAKCSLPDRAKSLAVVVTIAVLVGGVQYAKNYFTFGALLLEHQPVWLIPGLNEFADLAQRRWLASTSDIVLHGILQNFTRTDLYGYVQLLGLLGIVIGLRALWSDQTGRVMVFAIAVFFAFVVGLAFAGSLAAVKNGRYMLTIAPAFCFCAAVVINHFAGRVVAWSSEPRRADRWWFAPRLYLIAATVVLTATILQSLPMMQGRAAYLTAFRYVWQSRDREWVNDPRMHFGEEFRYLLRNPGKVLVFRQADFAFYGRPPWVDHLDPAILDFYRITDKSVAYYDLLRRGFSFLFVPNPAAVPTAFYNSQAAEVAGDPSLSELVAQRAGAVFKLRDRSTNVDCQAISPARIAIEGYGRENAVIATLLAALGWEPAINSFMDAPFAPDSLATITGVSQRSGERAGTIIFKGIDVRDDANTEASALGKRRLSIALDLAGEGIAEVVLQIWNEDAVLVDTIGLWSGLLNHGGRRVSLQSWLPPTATGLSLVVRKFRASVGSMEVKNIHLCRFEGPQTTASPQH